MSKSRKDVLVDSSNFPIREKASYNIVNHKYRNILGKNIVVRQRIGIIDGENFVDYGDVTDPIIIEHIKPESWTAEGVKKKMKKKSLKKSRKLKSRKLKSRKLKSKK